MQSYDVQQSSTAFPLVFLLISSTDHITGLTGATVTVTISKNGGAFASPAGTVTEMANGWYKVAGNATDTATLGPLLLHATATGADPTDQLYPVVAFSPQTTSMGLVLAKTTNLTGLNDIAATAIVSSGAITTSSGKVSEVALVDTLTTYTGNTPQTGDSFARIGSTGSGLSSLAPAATALSTVQWTNTRAAFLDNLSGGAVALASGVVLASAGLDAVVVEIGLNARQALSIIASAAGGTSTGALTGHPVYAGAGVATTRITATASGGDRSAVTLNIPA